MSESPVQRYLHELLQCPIENLPVFVEAGVLSAIQSWLEESAERQQDFDLLMAAARQEPVITEYACYCVIGQTPIWKTQTCILPFILPLGTISRIVLRFSSNMEPS